MRNVLRDRQHKKDALHTFCVICLENYKKIESHLESGFYLFVLEREKMNSVPTPSVLMTLIFSLWA